MVLALALLLLLLLGAKSCLGPTGEAPLGDKQPGAALLL
jgi:hypothetical protein